MEGEEAVDFQDWEVLHKSDDDSPAIISGSFVAIDADAAADGGVFRPDYFSLDGQNRNAEQGDAIASEEGSVESDNPSWVDPALETNPYRRKNSGEFWSDSSSDRSEEIAKRIGETEAEADNKKFGELGSSDLDGKEELNVLGDANSQLDKSSEKCFSDSVGDDELVSDLGNNVNVKIAETSESSGGMNSKELAEEEECSVESKDVVQVAEIKSDVVAGGDGEKRRIVWWKVPFEVLKYCVFKVNPVWSFSMAAAFMGFIILGRRLYKMKRKSQSLKLKVTMDDKVRFYVNNLVISIILRSLLICGNTLICSSLGIYL